MITFDDISYASTVFHHEYDIVDILRTSEMLTLNNRNKTTYLLSEIKHNALIILW